MTANIKLTENVFSINAQQWCGQIEAFIKEKLAASQRDGIVVTISGGLDSSVAATLCVRALGREKVKGLMLPERWGNPDADIYGHMIAENLGIETTQINISPILKGLGTSDFFLSATAGRKAWKNIVTIIMKMTGHTTKKDYLAFLSGKLDPSKRKLIAKISSKQRARLLAAYKFAEENNYILAGSTHKTEEMVGPFCKYGIDDCADIMPLKNKYRSQILQLAQYIKIPQEILSRSPNPDILPGVTDKYESYFGLTYRDIDLILFGFEQAMTPQEIAEQLGLTEQTVATMHEVVLLSERIREYAVAPSFGD